jgi:hypothetical protein
MSRPAGKNDNRNHDRDHSRRKGDALVYLRDARNRDNERGDHRDQNDRQRNDQHNHQGGTRQIENGRSEFNIASGKMPNDVTVQSH